MLEEQKKWMSVTKWARGRWERGREPEKKVGYYSQSTWGMFTEFNNSKWHHFIGFMDGCLSLPHCAALFRSFLTHTHVHYNTPTCNNYHGTLWCGFMENDRGVSIKGSWILLKQILGVTGESYLQHTRRRRCFTTLYGHWNCNSIQSKINKVKRWIYNLKSIKTPTQVKRLGTDIQSSDN